ncbi:MAG: hypothetical protein CME60_05425 [Halobacteriovoraceae bacterium]|nr:hypothetical protein [Halobacteriovoraceae bacterium]
MRNKRALLWVSSVTSLIFSTQVYSKTFNVINQQTNQTIQVSCMFPNTIQCKNKIEEAKQRVMNQTNPGARTLSEARMQDNARAVSDNVQAGYNSARERVNEGAQAVRETTEAGLQVAGERVRQGADAVGAGYEAAREGVVNGATAVRDRAQSGYETVRDGVVDGATAVRERTREGYENVRDGVANGAAAVSDRAQRGYESVRDGASQLASDVRGKTYRVSLPGHEHSMTFHCHGGLESPECQDEQAQVVAAIKSGTEAKTLQEYKMQPVTEVAGQVAQTATEVAQAAAATARDMGRATSNFISEQNHAYCARKLERHARDFDRQYSDSGQQHLVSYKDKMDYIREKLEDEGKFSTCEVHFENAVLGHQLKFVSGQVIREDTHIFDGLGRLHNGTTGYWKNEDRVDSYQTYRRSISQ